MLSSMFIRRRGVMHMVRLWDESGMFKSGYDYDGYGCMFLRLTWLWLKPCFACSRPMYVPNRRNFSFTFLCGS